MKDISVMYHYVRPINGWNGIVPIAPNQFADQIDYLNKYYEIVSPDELNKKGNKPKCVLTFDDATKDQYMYAFDIMKTKGVPGYFTVMSGVFVDKEVPIFHLVHAVLSLYTDEEIWDALNEEFVIENIDNRSKLYSYEANKLRRYNKYVLNFLLSLEQSRSFLEKRIFAKLDSKSKFIDQYYISIDEFKKMGEAGMTLGVHCVHHSPYSGEPLSFYKKEIEPCAQFMISNLGVKPRWYTPAFGGGERNQEMMKDLKNILIENGFTGGFTTIKGYNEGLTQFWLNRFDCNIIQSIVNR